MRLERREHPEAHDELREAAYWYDERQPGLGEDFVDTIDDAIVRISDWPNSAPEFPGWVGSPPVRSMEVAIFPYRVVYYITGTSLVILAYAHERRKPGYWQHRLDR